MAQIGVFIERYTLTRSEEMGAVLRLGQAAQRMGHRLDVLFRADMYKIPSYDALFIRALTDPLNSSYVASRLADSQGLRVVDDPTSILVCCDKINMYRHLQAAGVPMPETFYLTEKDLTKATGERLLDLLGTPIVLKAPNTSFSMYVDRVSSPEDFVRVGKRFLRRADRLVAQKFIPSEFDWRVGVLGGEVLFVCQYLIPKRRWKVLTYTEGGRVIWGRVKNFEIATMDPKLRETAIQAAKAIGNGLYGIDLKQSGDGYVVIEVNDNPTICEGEEDRGTPAMYERLVSYLAREWG